MANKKRGKAIRKIKNSRLIRNEFKAKKYWLIGGKIGAIIGLLICLISMLVLLSYNLKCSGADNCMLDSPKYVRVAYSVFSVSSWPIIEFIKSGKMQEITYIILGVLILIVEYFFAGAIIGEAVHGLKNFLKKR